ncbi:MAG TPA: helix-hairpin-helix domain-containing protein [Pyrinomonadaceae bacterium]|nr:helix-hairpin-helix domain-containing protein [Pyrinomonadaceae bacterium]
MKTPVSLVLLCTLAVAAATSACVKLPRRARAETEAAQKDIRRAESGASRVNLNTATRAELERLPGVGPSLASRIVEHRERHGPFRRPEHLIAVRGFSERRFRTLRDLIEV